MKIIKKIGGIILKNQRMLVVRKQGTKVYIMPGGTQENGETNQETLRRELKEELNVDSFNYKFFGNFREKAIFGEGDVDMYLYFSDVEDDMEPRSEIVELKWIDSGYKDHGVKLGSVIEKHTLPVLIKEELIK